MGRPVKVEGRDWAADVAALRRIAAALDAKRYAGASQLLGVASTIERRFQKTARRASKKAARAR